MRLGSSTALCTYLLSFVMQEAFVIFQHLLSPQFEEVIWISVEFKAIFAVISIAVQLI